MSSEQPALEAVYRSSALALPRLAYLLVGDRTEAEDIVHTVFASVVPRGRRSTSRRRTCAAWSSTVPTTSIAGRSEPLRQLTPPVARSSSPTSTRRGDSSEHCRRTQRTVVVLRFYEDLSLTQIVSLLGRPASTVRSDLRRALTRLRRSLA